MKLILSTKLEILVNFIQNQVHLKQCIFNCEQFNYIFNRNCTFGQSTLLREISGADHRSRGFTSYQTFLQHCHG